MRISGRFFPFRWRLKRRAKQPVISVDDPDLRVVAEAFDDSEAASSALARAESWMPDSPAVLRHHLRIPEAEVATARRLLEAENWITTVDEPASYTADQHSDLQEGEISVLACRIQQLDSLHCSQESSRMAGLAQRLRGRALGWDALQPAHDAESG